MTQKTNPWTFDVRVRERNLKAGSLTDKDVEKYLAQLPDNGDQTEAFGTSQPALEQPDLPDDLDDEEEDEEEADDEADDVGGSDDAITNGAVGGGSIGGDLGDGSGSGSGSGDGEGT